MNTPRLTAAGVALEGKAPQPRIAGKRGKLAPNIPKGVPRLRDVLVADLPMPTKPFNNAGVVHLAGNGIYGDCVLAGWCNFAQTTSNFPSFSGAYVYPGDDAVIAKYEQMTGSKKPPGPGLELTQAIQAGLAKGGLLGMQIAAWCTIDPDDQELVLQAAYNFGAVYAGYALPADAEEEFEDDGYFHLSDPGEAPAEGHCMVVSGGGGEVETSLGERPDLIAETWATSLPMTFAFAEEYQDECHVLIPTWMRSAGHDAIQALDWQALQQAMDALAAVDVAA